MGGGAATELIMTATIGSTSEQTKAVKLELSSTKTMAVKSDDGDYDNDDDVDDEEDEDGDEDDDDKSDKNSHSVKAQTITNPPWIQSSTIMNQL